MRFRCLVLVAFIAPLVAVLLRVDVRSVGGDSRSKHGGQVGYPDRPLGDRPLGVELPEGQDQALDRRELPQEPRWTREYVDHVLAPVRNWLAQHDRPDHGPLSAGALSSVLDEQIQGIESGDRYKAGVGGDPQRADLVRRLLVAERIERYEAVLSGAYVAVDDPRPMTLYNQLVDAFSPLPPRSRLRLCLVIGVTDGDRRLAVITVMNDHMTAVSRALDHEVIRYDANLRGNAK